VVSCDGCIATDNGHKGWCINEYIELFSSVNTLVLSSGHCLLQSINVCALQNVLGELADGLEKIKK